MKLDKYKDYCADSRPLSSILLDLRIRSSGRDTDPRANIVVRTSLDLIPVFISKRESLLENLKYSLDLRLGDGTYFEFDRMCREMGFPNGVEGFINHILEV